MKKSREATDPANVRSAYAEIMTEVILGNMDRKLQKSGNTEREGELYECSNRRYQVPYRIYGLPEV